MTHSCWTADFRDADLTFFMLVYKDHERADASLRRLRHSFPHARTIVRSDGDDDPRHEQLVGRYGVEYRAEQRLFTIVHGGAIVQRMFDIFFERPSRFLFKIDPDTVVHRRFRYLPARSGHFGTVQDCYGSRAVQGGCMGYTVEAASALAESGLLRHPDLRRPHASRQTSNFWNILARRAERAGLASFDWTVGWAAEELDIPVFDFPEVHSEWKTPVSNHDLRFAVTHPAVSPSC